MGFFRMNEQVTIVVVPRDRFSSVVACVESILENTTVPYRLVILDFGYSNRTKAQVEKLAARAPMEFVACGRTIPLQAFRDYLARIQTQYVAWVDNDTYVTPGWLEALLNRAAQGARVILPMTLERDGLDVDPRKIPLRVHITHSELRRTIVDGVPYVFDHKPFRRAAPEDVPQEPHVVDFFELHTFFAETEVLRQLDLPPMVVREHIDIGIQLHKMGIPIWCEPKSVVQFDNIHERPTLADLRFFLFRWSQRLIDDSHDQFEKRWGYRFYNERFMKNWAFRRKVFSAARFVGLPQRPADFLSRVFNKLFCKKIPPQLSKDPLAQSERVLGPSPALAEIG
jgi:glycosyltransferase involved in cell wall biosynthesis